MARTKPLPVQDALLTARLAAALIGMSKSRWWAYARRYPALVRGRRFVSVMGGKQSPRWLQSALVEHMHLELPSFIEKPDEQAADAAEKAGVA